jgi:hypothetical protein
MPMTEQKQYLPILDGNKAIVGHWRFDVEPVDGFGTRRATKFGHVKVSELHEAVDSTSVEGKTVFDQADVDAIFLHLGSDRERHLRVLADAFARASGTTVDGEWPLLAVAWPEGRRAAARLNAPVQPQLPSGYQTSREQTQIDLEAATAIAELQTLIEREAESCASETRFSTKYGVRHIIMVGSTSRKTYATSVVDFDLLIDCAIRQVDIAREDMKALVDRLVQRVTTSREYSRYVHCIAHELVGGSHALQESFFGVRGKESFVSRHAIESAGGSCNLLDITFGCLPQLIGYTTWIRRYLHSLQPARHEQVCGEIRLAKCLLSGFGGLYGPGLDAFRGHLVEQFIIQGLNYRCGSSTASLANSLALIADEVGSAHGAVEFADYKDRFPLWHPGWWETTVGFSDAQPGVNLWNLLGRGGQAAAELQWRKLEALALAHVHICEHDLHWSVSEMVTAAKTIFAARNRTACLEGGHRYEASTEQLPLK